MEKEKIIKSEDVIKSEDTLVIICLISFIFVIILLIIVGFMYLSFNKIYDNIILKTNELNLKLDTTLKLFDCRNIQRNDIIIGIENQSLLDEVKNKFSFSFNEDYLIDNPYICEDGQQCQHLMFSETNETADWIIVNSQCKLYGMNLKELV